MVVTLNKQKYTLRFGYGALRLLGQYWEVKDLPDVMNKLASVFPESEKQAAKVSQFDRIDTVIDLLRAGIVCANANAGFSDQDLQDFVFQKPEVVKDVIIAFMQSMPKQQKPQDSLGK